MLRRDRWEDDLGAELRDHVDLRAADLVRVGMGKQEALRTARMELGSVERYKDEVRASVGLRWLDDFRQDARYALRTLRRSPGFTMTAVASLALGVGANTVVFSVLSSVILRPLPVSEPERLHFVQLQESDTSVSFPAYRDLRDRAATIDGAIAYRPVRMG
ncbi:MAG: permease prefix domain 1-containing protein, partial [Acidobacteriota bacterium]